MKKSILILTFLAFAISGAVAQELDSEAIYEQAKKHLIALLGIDTSQPNPQETEATRYLYKELNKHYIDWDLLSPRKGKANLLARLKGTDLEAKPLLLISHLDTAPATDHWAYPPYKATLMDGKIYGLGATDAKNYTAMHLALFTALKESGLPLKRDVILLATSGEEFGSDTGLKWLGDTQWSHIAAGYALNEGGSIIKNTPTNVPLIFAEAGTKMYMDLKITAQGQALHSSLPVQQNAVYHLSEILAKLNTFDPPARLTPTAREFFRRIAPLQDEDAQTTIQLLLYGTPQEQQMAAEMMAQDPFFRSQLKDTLTPTSVSSGTDTGASAAEVSAIINVRLLPDTDPEKFIEDLKTFLGKDESISIEIVERPQLPFPEPMTGNDELFTAIEQAAINLWPDAVATAAMSPASGDSEYLRRLGVITYGLGPALSTQADAPSAHTADEYISEKDYQEQVRFFTEVVKNFVLNVPQENPAHE
ncbi:MAG: M20/M25/M40 family metallo-hydrolase [Elusimicrobiaceae bacterium]|nr:M20/M25/M40 family metallo-hydrolase [Elusimicrobiaceae bacterium]